MDERMNSFNNVAQSVQGDFTSLGFNRPGGACETQFAEEFESPVDSKLYPHVCADLAPACYVRFEAYAGNYPYFVKFAVYFRLHKSMFDSGSSEYVFASSKDGPTDDEMIRAYYENNQAMLNNDAVYLYSLLSENLNIVQYISC